MHEKGSINYWVDKIMKGGNQDMEENVWDLVLSSATCNVYTNILSGLENRDKDLALYFAYQVIKQNIKSY